MIRPGNKHHQLLTMHPATPPIANNADAVIPILAARRALGVPESDIITFGMNVIKPRNNPVVNIPQRIKAFPKRSLFCWFELVLVLFTSNNDSSFDDDGIVVVIGLEDGTPPPVVFFCCCEDISKYVMTSYVRQFAPS